jgi:hypothetical protein
MESFNVVSTAVVKRAMPPLKESPTKVASYTLVASSDLDKSLDITKGVIGGASAPTAKMGSQLANWP